MSERNYSGPYGTFPMRSDNAPHVTAAEIAAHECERLRVALEWERGLGDRLRRERQMVEAVLGRVVPDNGMPQAVRDALGF